MTTNPLERSIYVSSKRQHVELWRTWRKRGYNIISSWIDMEGSWDTETIGRELWPKWISEAARADHLIVYSAPWDNRHESALLEIGAALAAGRMVLSVGASESMKTANGEWADFIHHPNWKRLIDLDAAFKFTGCEIVEQSASSQILDEGC